jgi:hypothetical protein
MTEWCSALWINLRAYFQCFCFHVYFVFMHVCTLADKVVEMVLSEARKLIENRDDPEMQELLSAAAAPSGANGSSSNEQASASNMKLVEDTSSKNSVCVQHDLDVAPGSIRISFNPLNDTQRQQPHLWTDGDMVCLRCCGSVYKSSEQPYECFEYVDDMAAPILMPLPSYGGVFELVYMSPIVGRTNEYTVCGVSERLTLSGGVFAHHPDNPHKQTHNPAAAGSQSQRRRGTGPLVNTAAVATAATSMMEYLQGINVVNIHWLVCNQSPHTDCTVTVNRVNAWVFPSRDNKSVSVVVEYDVAHVDPSNHSVSIHTSYLCADDVQFQSSNIDYRRCQCTVDQSTSNKLSLRIQLMDPLKLDSSALRSNVVTLSSSSSSSAAGAESGGMSLCCRYCEADLVPPGVIKKIESLPTGYFDNVRVCCCNFSVESMFFC